MNAPGGGGAGGPGLLGLVGLGRVGRGGLVGPTGFGVVGFGVGLGFGFEVVGHSSQYQRFLHLFLHTFFNLSLQVVVGTF